VVFRRGPSLDRVRRTKRITRVARTIRRGCRAGRGLKQDRWKIRIHTCQVSLPVPPSSDKHFWAEIDSPIGFSFGERQNHVCNDCFLPIADVRVVPYRDMHALNRCGSHYSSNRKSLSFENTFVCAIPSGQLECVVHSQDTTSSTERNK
jgi:hypothetical protein